MNERDFTLLNDYFNGLLAPDDAQAVEARAATEAEFGEEFSLRQQMEAYPRRAALRKSFTDTLTAVETDFFQEKASKTPDIQPPMTAKVNRMRWLAAAAALVLLAVAVWFISSPEPAEYNQYAQHVPLSLTLRGAADQAASEAENAFNEKNYPAALAALNRLLAEQPDTLTKDTATVDPSRTSISYLVEPDTLTYGTAGLVSEPPVQRNNNLTAQLYKGICLIELDRTADARAILVPIANDTSALRIEATWYVALSYLKEKNTAACRDELLKIPSGDVRYEQAQVLLKKLKE